MGQTAIPDSVTLSGSGICAARPRRQDKPLILAGIPEAAQRRITDEVTKYEMLEGDKTVPKDAARGSAASAPLSGKVSAVSGAVWLGRFCKSLELQGAHRPHLFPKRATQARAAQPAGATGGRRRIGIARSPKTKSKQQNIKDG